jgi:hypothetical protein
MTDKRKPSKRVGIPASKAEIPPQHSATDTSNWDDKPFYASEEDKALDDKQPVRKKSTAGREMIYHAQAYAKNERNIRAPKINQNNAEPESSS